MTYYHPSKDAALAAGAAYESHWEARAELDAYNGWVLILKAKSAEVFNWPLLPLVEVAELDLEGVLGRIGRLRRAPADRKRPPPASSIQSRSAPRPAPAPPPKPPAPPPPPPPPPAR